MSELDVTGFCGGMKEAGDFVPRETVVSLSSFVSVFGAAPRSVVFRGSGIASVGILVRESVVVLGRVVGGGRL